MSEHSVLLMHRCHFLRTIFAAKCNRLGSLLLVIRNLLKQSRNYSCLSSSKLYACNCWKAYLRLILCVLRMIFELTVYIHLCDIYPVYNFFNWIKIGQASSIHIYTFNSLIHSMRVISRTPTCITYPRWFRSHKGGSHTYIRTEIPA